MTATRANPYDSMTVDELKAVVVAKEAAEQRIHAEKLAAVAALDRRTGGLVPDMPAEGITPVFAPTAAWLRSQTPLGPGAAASVVRTARLLDAIPAVATASLGGELGSEQAVIVARGLERLDDRDLAETAAPVWIEYAKECEPEPLRRRLREWVASHAEEVFERQSASDRDRRGLRLTPDVDGMTRVRGLLDPASATIVCTAIESLAKRKTDDDDDRPYTQRLCDAFTEICDRVMRHDDDLPLFGGAAPSVIVTITDQDLCGRGGGTSAYGPLPRWSLETLACDANISRVVMTPESVVVDVGRSLRLVTPHLRRALIARDKGCVRKGCGRPPAWCDAHHLVAWEVGGGTDLDNCVLLCRRHHVMWHQGLIGLKDLNLPWLWSLAEAGRPPPVLA